MKLLRRLWKDEAGFIVSLELILVTILLVIGMVTGLQILRDAILNELGDLGMAIGAINNSYAFTGSSTPAGTAAGISQVDGSFFQDGQDLNDTTNGSIGGGIIFGMVGVVENTALPATAGGT